MIPEPLYSNYHSVAVHDMRVFLLPTPPKAREVRVQIEKFGNLSPLRFGADLTLVIRYTTLRCRL